MQKNNLLLFLLVLSTISSSVSQTVISGYWAGGSNLFPGRYGFISASFNGKDDSYFNASGWDAAKRKIKDLRLNGSRVHFEFPSASGSPFILDGELENDIIRGKIIRGKDTGNFHLIKTDNSEKPGKNKFVGTYETGSGKRILVTWGAFAHLRIISLDEGSAGEALIPFRGDSFFLSRSVIGSVQPEDILKFERSSNGSIIGFKLFNRDSLVLSAQRKDEFNQKPVTFFNRDIKLTGTLFTPLTGSFHSAIVFVHGSQDRGRDDNYLFGIADGYLKLGIAVLIFDKRGVGGSTGDWHIASFDDLADDVLAGVRFLRGQSNINKSEIGLEGISQGGWIAPLAAAKDRQISYMVLISAAGVSPAEQVIYDQLGKMRRAGINEKDLKEAEQFLKLQFRAAKNENEWNIFQKTIPTVSDRKWFPYTLGPVPKDSWIWESTRLTANFEPASVWKRINCPVLLMLGGADPNYPAEKSATLIKNALTSKQKDALTVKIFEGANHSIMVQDQHGRWRSAPDPDETKYNWLITHADVDF